VKSSLQRIPVPGEREAQERAWLIVAAAHADQEPVPRRSRRPRVALAAALATASVVAVVTPSGRAVIDRVREVIGIEHAQPALFSLPTQGQLLVRSDSGVWVVRKDGSKRLLGGYREASWSPFGRFVVAVAARGNELAALELNGDVRWTLARPGIRSPTWTGSAVDTRIAYTDNSGLRVVAGDGTGDRRLVPGARGPLAWRPGPTRHLAYVLGGDVFVEDVQTGRVVWRTRFPSALPATAIEWSSDGKRVLVLAPHALRVYDARGRVVAQDDPSEGWPDVDAAFRPGTHDVAVARVHGSQSTVFWLATGRALFSGTGVFEGLAWSPDGRWLFVTWPTADQWVFVSAGGLRRIRAVANVSTQFRSRTFPRVDGWCCAR